MILTDFCYVNCHPTFFEGLENHYYDHQVLTLSYFVEEVEEAADYDDDDDDDHDFVVT